MKIEITLSFREKPGNQLKYISKDKPEAARKFKKEIIKKIKHLAQNLYFNRKSIYFDRSDIRDLIFKSTKLFTRLTKQRRKYSFSVLQSLKIIF